MAFIKVAPIHDPKKIWNTDLKQPLRVPATPPPHKTSRQIIFVDLFHSTGCFNEVIVRGRRFCSQKIRSPLN
ncbi:hypothetical protein BN1263460231 [Stenotrophomonas indicatrix]|nr:hypothetical protein BN1263460231 [Stenotrophomonas indicatrix]